MRKVTYGAACSLDQMIAGPDGEMDWLHWSDDVTAIMGEYWKNVDTIVMGRKTYEFAAKSNQGGDSGAFAGVASYVCSRTLTKLDGDGVLVADAVQLIRNLKAKPGKDICIMGGGVLGQSLLDAGMLDEVGMNIHPIVLGRGVPFFPGGLGRVALELQECRQLAGGCVYVTYRVKSKNG